jgi:hypothetical protein
LFGHLVGRITTQRQLGQEHDPSAGVRGCSDPLVERPEQLIGVFSPLVLNKADV